MTRSSYHNPVAGSDRPLVLEEVGVPTESSSCGSTRTSRKRRSSQVNPMGKLPTIVHRGVVVTEAAVSCVPRRCFSGEAAGAALDDPRRGTYLRWLFFAAGCLEPLHRQVVSAQGVAEAMSVAWGSTEATLDTTESAITPGPYCSARSSPRPTCTSARCSATDDHGVSTSVRARRVREAAREPPASKRAGAQNQA